MRIDQYLTSALQSNASDLHFVSGDPVRARIHGNLQVLDKEPLAVDTVRECMFEIMDGTTQRDFEQDDAADFAYEIPEVSRFRVNVFRHLNGIGAIFRAIPSQALTLADLSMPKVVHELCRHTQGMILVTGKTGSGKSTTLAAMIDSMNKRLKGHILTIEDPVEFVHKAQGCLISQREIGVHSPTFAEALHSALREDPDVVLVGEMRDLETISIAVTAAEMGILVMGTLHTNGAGQTVDRIAALEILVNTPAVANLIRQGKLDQLETAMQSGGNVGMQTMDTALMELVRQGLVSGKEAYQQANDKSKFQRMRDED